jgi:hypothetical protein
MPMLALALFGRCRITSKLAIAGIFVGREDLDLCQMRLEVTRALLDRPRDHRHRAGLRVGTGARGLERNAPTRQSDVCLVHGGATFGAAAAGFGATPHLPVRVDVLFAKRSAGIADLGAFGANVHVMRRPTCHEIGTERAHLRAVQQRDQVLGLRVVLAAVKKMGNRLRADPVALQTVADALLH